jgi:hypothetical protein
MHSVRRNRETRGHELVGVVSIEDSTVCDGSNSAATILASARAPAPASPPLGRSQCLRVPQVVVLLPGGASCMAIPRSLATRKVGWRVRTIGTIGTVPAGSVRARVPLVRPMVLQYNVCTNMPYGGVLRLQELLGLRPELPGRSAPLSPI